MKITIFTVCDYKYLNNFYSFAKSYILNEINKEFVEYIHFFIYKDEKDLKLINDKILKEFNKYINFKFIKYDNHNLDFKFFCCHYRFKALKFLFENNSSDIFIYSDIDAYINKSLYEKINILKENCYFFLRANKNKNVIVNKSNLDILKIKNNVPKIGRTYILSGVIIIKNNSVGKKIVNKIIETYNNLDKITWFSDQIVLDKLFWSDKFKIGILDRVYFDLNLNNENILLLCKGKEFSEERSLWKNIIKKNDEIFENKIINNQS